MQDVATLRRPRDPVTERADRPDVHDGAGDDLVDPLLQPVQLDAKGVGDPLLEPGTDVEADDAPDEGACEELARIEAQEQAALAEASGDGLGDITGDSGPPGDDSGSKGGGKAEAVIELASDPEVMETLKEEAVKDATKGDSTATDALVELPGGDGGPTGDTTGDTTGGPTLDAPKDFKAFDPKPSGDHKIASDVMGITGDVGKHGKGIAPDVLKVLGADEDGADGLGKGLGTLEDASTVGKDANKFASALTDDSATDPAKARLGFTALGTLGDKAKDGVDRWGPDKTKDADGADLDMSSQPDDVRTADDIKTGIGVGSHVAKVGEQASLLAEIGGSDAREHDKADKMLGAIGTGGKALGDALKDTAKLSGLDDGDADKIGFGGDAVSHLASGGQGINTAIDALGKDGSKDESDVHNDADKASKVIGGIKTGGEGLIDATSDVTKIVGDVDSRTDETGTDVPLTDDLATGKAGFSATAGLAKAIADGVSGLTKKDATDIDKGQAGLGMLGDGADKGGEALKHWMKLGGETDLGEDVGLGGKATKEIAGMPLSVLDAIEKFKKKDATEIDKADAIGTGVTDVVGHGIEGAKHITDIVGDDDVGTDLDLAGDVNTGVAGMFGGGIGMARGADKISKGKETGDDWKVAEGGLEIGGHGLNVGKHGIDLTDLALGGGNEALDTASAVTGGFGTGILGVAKMIGKGKDAAESIKKAHALREGGEVGKDIGNTLDERRAKLAERFGISMEDDGWQDKVDDRIDEELEKADDHEKDYTKLRGDEDVDAYMDQKGLDDIRAYAHLRKGLKAGLDTTEAVGGGLQALGTGTAPVDGGITKTVGTVMSIAPSIVRIGDKIIDRGEGASRQVEATDAMKGYDKKGFFGRMGDTIKGGVSSLGTTISESPIGDAGRAIGKGAKNAWEGTKDVAKTVGGGIKSGAESAWKGTKSVASTIGGGIKTGAEEAWKGTKAVASKVSDGASGLFGWIKKKGSALTDKVSKAATKAGGWVKDKATALSDTISASPLGDAGRYIGKKVGDAGDALAKTSIGKSVVDAKVSLIGGVDDNGVEQQGSLQKGASKAWEGAKSLVSSTGDAISSGANKAWDGMKSVGTSIADGAETLGCKTKLAAKSAGKAIKSGAKAVVGGVTSLGTTIGGGIKRGAEATWDGMKTAGTAVKDNVLDPIGSGIKKGAETTWDGIKTAGTAVKDNVLDPIGSGIKKGAETTWDGIKTAGTAVKDNVLDPIGSGIKKGATAVKDNVLDPIGSGIKKGATAVKEHVLDPIGSGIKKGADAVYDNVLAPAGRGIKSGAETVYDKALKPVGETIAKPFKAFGQWFKEDVWETSDMKWARKLGVMVVGPKVDEVRKTWEKGKANPDSPEGKQIAKLREHDHDTFLEIEEGLKADDNPTENARELAKMAMGVGVDAEVADDANDLLGTLGVERETNKFASSLAKIKGLRRMGADPSKLKGPEKKPDDGTADSEENDLRITGPDGEELPLEKRIELALKRSNDVKDRRRARLAGRIEDEFMV